MHAGTSAMIYLSLQKRQSYSQGPRHVAASLRVLSARSVHPPLCPFPIAEANKEDAAVKAEVAENVRRAGVKEKVLEHVRYGTSVWCAMGRVHADWTTPSFMKDGHVCSVRHCLACVAHAGDSHVVLMAIWASGASS